jgi:hypothetical protein
MECFGRCRGENIVDVICQAMTKGALNGGYRIEAFGTFGNDYDCLLLLRKGREIPKVLTGCRVGVLQESSLIRL